jgi:hypothetical protein
LPTHPDELQFGILWQVVHPFDDPKHRSHDIDRAVAITPELVDTGQRLVYVALLTELDHSSDLQWVRLITDLEDIVLGHKAETGPRRLEIVDGLSHVSLCSENQRCKALIVVLDLMSRKYQL